MDPDWWSLLSMIWDPTATYDPWKRGYKTVAARRKKWADDLAKFWETKYGISDNGWHMFTFNTWEHLEMISSIFIS